MNQPMTAPQRAKNKAAPPPKPRAAAVATAIFTRIGKVGRAVKRFVLNLNDDSIFALWIALIFLAGTLIWGFTTKPRSVSMAAAANRMLTEIGDSRLVDEPLSLWRLPGPASATGLWYTMTTSELALIFPVYYEGTFCPCLTIFTADGRIDTFLPLSRMGRISTVRTPGGVFKAQLAHAEKAARLIIQKINGDEH